MTPSTLVLATSAISINAFSLLAPALTAIGPNVGISALAYLPLLNPEEPVQFEVDPRRELTLLFLPCLSFDWRMILVSKQIVLPLLVMSIRMMLNFLHKQAPLRRSSPIEDKSVDGGIYHETLDDVPDGGFGCFVSSL